MTWPTPRQDVVFKVITSNATPAGFLSFCTTVLAVVKCSRFGLPNTIVSFLWLRVKGLRTVKADPESPNGPPHMRHK